MSVPILTPISLWKDFTVNTDFYASMVEERAEDGIISRFLYFGGRKEGEESVRIFAVEVYPVERENAPAILLLDGRKKGVNISLAKAYAKKGYTVLAVDYSGEKEGTPYTRYPSSLAYANLKNCENDLLHAQSGAKKTCWYEWTAVAAYAVGYLRSLPYVTNIGAIGIRDGGELVWKLMTIEKLSCGIAVDAAGWLAYRGVRKFGEERLSEMDEDRRLFLAGIDSQSYAPFVKCPILMLMPTVSGFSDIDRAFDTLARVNQEHFATLEFCTELGASVDNKGMKDLDMFLEKYLMEREIFIPKPQRITIDDNGEELFVSLTSDASGEIVKKTVYFAEDDQFGSARREWMVSTDRRVLEEEDNREVFVLPVYEKTEKVLAFIRTEYTNGFSVSTKIASKNIEKKYVSSVLYSPILFDGRDMGASGFYPVSSASILPANKEEIARATLKIEKGYGQIPGIASYGGLKTYRIAAKRYAPKQNAILHLAVYTKEDTFLTIGVKKKPEDIVKEYTRSIAIKGGKWNNIVLSPVDVKDEIGRPLDSFKGCFELFINAEKDEYFITDNILWM